MQRMILSELLRKRMIVVHDPRIVDSNQSFRGDGGRAVIKALTSYEY